MNAHRDPDAAGRGSVEKPMQTNDLADENDCGTATGTKTRDGPPADEITSTFTAPTNIDDRHTRHLEPLAVATHTWDHRRTTYVYAEDDGRLLIQARYTLHGDLQHIHEDTFELDADEAPLDHARDDWNRNPSGSVGVEFESAVGCGRPLHLRLRDLRDRLRIRARSALAAALGGV